MRARQVLLVLGVAACGRIDEPPPSRPASVVAAPIASPPPEREPAATVSPAAPPAPAAPSSTASCVVPMPADAPPRAAPAKNCPPDPTGNPVLPRAHLTFVDAPGAPRVVVERALTNAHRSRGLMYRTEMPEAQGMLFSWNTDQVQSFWMRNTCIPLDMLFIARDGTIAGVLEQVPTMNDAPRSIPCPVAHVLELNAGYSRAHGVRAGQRVKIE
jgi:uncharacterized protein